MKKRVLDYVRKYQLITNGDHVIVGLSGGADSVCLLLMLRNMQKDMEFSIEAVHVNHNLRGQEALRDQTFVENLCEQFGVKLTIKSIEVAAYAEQNKIGLEEAGRKVRYDIFEQLIKERASQNDECQELLNSGMVKIALAHHQNDLAETMLYHLARGTDLTGLAGIRPKRGHYIRPLLCMSRQEVEQYLETEEVAYVNDSSNAEDTYTRNKIRHHVVEYLEKEVNIKSVQHINETAQSLAELQDYLVQEGLQKFEQYGEEIENGVFFHTSLWSEPKVLVFQVIRTGIQLLSGTLKDFTREHIQMVYELAEKEVHKEVHLPYGLIGQKTYKGIFIKKREDRGYENDAFFGKKQEGLTIGFAGKYLWNDLQIQVELLEGKLEEIPENRYTKWFDYDKMKCTPELRYRKTGDYIVVNQQGGKKKIKDYFIDKKIAKKDRDQVPLLCCGQDVLWVVGYRISEGYKVTEQTKHIFKIQVLGGCYHE